MIRPILVRPECVEAAGDLVTGVLLSQIVYWSSPGRNGKSKLITQRNGVYWIAKTREQWIAETGMTLDQYRRAITVLKRKGLVESRLMKYQGDTVTHLRLLATMGDPPVETGKTPHPVGEGTSTNLKGSKNTKIEEDRDCSGETRIEIRLYTYGDLSGVGHLGVEGVGSTGSRGSPDLKGCESTGAEPRVEDDVGKHEGWLMKAQDVLKTHTPSKTGNLGTYWKSRMATVWGGYQHPLTNKEHGQLRQLAKYLGAETKPVIDYAINHWWKFASQAGASAGTSFPAEPQIGYLLKHHAVAVNLLMPQQATGSPPMMEETPVQSIATGTDEEPVKVLSSQELTELLAGFKSP